MNHCPQMPLSGQRHNKGIYQREDVQIMRASKVNAFCYFMPYILDILRPPRWVILSVWGNFPRGNCKYLSMSGIRQPFFVWCSYRSLSTRGSLALSPLCRLTGIRLQRRTYKDYTLATLSLPPHRHGHGRGQGVETSLVCRRVAR